MIRFLRSLAWAALISISLVSTKGFGSGGSTGNHGTGLRCADGLHLLDLVLAEKEGLEPDRLSDANILERLSKRLKPAHPLLYARVLSEFTALDRIEWPNGRIPNEFDALLESKPAPGCAVVPISRFDSLSTPPTLNSEYVSEYPADEIPALKLHEAFYRTGVRHYGHFNAVLTQKAVGAIAAHDLPADFSVRVSRFTRFKEPLQDEPNGRYVLDGYYTEAVPPHLPRFDCPPSLNLIRTGGYGTQVQALKPEGLVWSARARFMPSTEPGISLAAEAGLPIAISIRPLPGQPIEWGYQGRLRCAYRRALPFEGFPDSDVRKSMTEIYRSDALRLPIVGR